MIVNAEQLNKFMSSPDWTPDQRQFAEYELLPALEDGLEKALFGAYVTPRPLVEVAPVLSSGLVATRQVVFSLSKVDGVVVDEAHPLAYPWVLSEQRLRYAALTGATASGAYTTWGASLAAHTRARGSVQVEYMGGWGAAPALKLAILRKAKVLFLNQFDDSVLARAMDPEKPVGLAEEDWTEEELKPLGAFRNLTGAAWRA